MTITFTNPIDVNRGLSIDGGGTTTFSTGSTAQLFVISSAVTFSVNRLTMRGTGTAISNTDGFVTVTNSTLANNQTALDSNGGMVTIGNMKRSRMVTF